MRSMLYQSIPCIIQKHEELFEARSSEFVEQAYFDCIVGLKQKAKRAAAVVFGENHPHLTLLFEKSPSGEYHSQNCEATWRTVG